MECLCRKNKALGLVLSSIGQKRQNYKKSHSLSLIWCSRNDLRKWLGQASHTQICITFQFLFLISYRLFSLWRTSGLYIRPILFLRCEDGFKNNFWVCLGPPPLTVASFGQTGSVQETDFYSLELFGRTWNHWQTVMKHSFEVLSCLCIYSPGDSHLRSV